MKAMSPKDRYPLEALRVAKRAEPFLPNTWMHVSMPSRQRPAVGRPAAFDVHPVERHRHDQSQVQGSGPVHHAHEAKTFNLQLFRLRNLVRCLTLPLLLLALGGCADHIGLTFAEAPRDFTATALQSRLDGGRPVSAVGYPLGTSVDGRRCGGPLGETGVPGLPKREPLRSSIAWATDGLLGNPFGPGQTYERQLRAASIRHDHCYGHGLATYGRERRDCDLGIRADALRLCQSVEGSETRARCELRGEIPFLAVAPLGWTFYGDNLQNTCEYDPGLNPPRDFVLPGRFLKVPGVLPGQVLHAMPQGGSLRLRITGFSAMGATDPVSLLDALIPFDAVAFTDNWTSSPPQGRCVQAPCTLASAGLRPQDVLALAPKIADLDGDGLDDVAFIAVHGLADPYTPGRGMIAFAVSPAAGLTDPARIAAGVVRTQDETAAADPAGRLSPWALRQQIDVLGQPWHAGRFLDGTRDQLLLATLRVERGADDRRLSKAQERGYAEFRLLDFPKGTDASLGPPRLRRTLFRDDGLTFRTRTDRVPRTELYRRFQNPPIPWRDANGRSGILLLARDWLDSADAADFGIPDGVWKKYTQDRGIRVFAYGPPASPASTPVPDRNLRTENKQHTPTGCADLAAWDPDWFGCRRSVPDAYTVHDRFVWNWTRDVNPVLALPDVSNRHAAVALDVDPADPRREALVFYLTPRLHPALLARQNDNDHRFVQRAYVRPRAGADADSDKATEAGSWLAYPALAARLGPGGEAGLALFRTVPHQEGAAIEIATALPADEGRSWSVIGASCILPPSFAAVNVADRNPGKEGGAMAHLRLSPVLRLAGENGARDAFAIAVRDRADSGAVRSISVGFTAIRPEGTVGWTLAGRQCASFTFTGPP